MIYRVTCQDTHTGRGYAYTVEAESFDEARKRFQIWDGLITINSIVLCASPTYFLMGLPRESGRADKSKIIMSGKDVYRVVRRSGQHRGFVTLGGARVAVEEVYHPEKEEFFWMTSEEARNTSDIVRF